MHAENYASIQAMPKLFINIEAISNLGGHERLGKRSANALAGSVLCDEDDDAD